MSQDLFWQLWSHFLLCRIDIPKRSECSTLRNLHHKWDQLTVSGFDYRILPIWLDIIASNSLWFVFTLLYLPKFNGLLNLKQETEWKHTSSHRKILTSTMTYNESSWNLLTMWAKHRAKYIISFLILSILWGHSY